MSQLANGLSKVIGESAPSTTQVRPVSRVSFSLTDTDAFEKSVKFAVDWLSGKIGGVLPDEAKALASFDTRGVDGLHPCHVVRLDDRAGSIWAARIDEPGSDVNAGETWTTEIFVEKPSGGLVRFGAQLMARRPQGSPDLRPSRPRLVYDLLQTLSAEADGEAICDAPVSLRTASDAEALANLIYRPGRRLPVVAVSTDHQDRAQINLHQLGVRLSGAAHLVLANPDTTWELTRLVGKRMSTYSGAVRIYMPGLVEDDEDPYQHPLWLAPNSGKNSMLLNLLADRIFPLGFHDQDGDSRFWHIGQLRKAASASAQVQASGTEVEILQSELEALNDDIIDLNEKLDLAAGLERIAHGNEKAAQELAQKLQDENARLKAENFRLRSISGLGDGAAIEQKKDRSLSSYDELEDWAEEVLGPHIHIHNKALKECKRNGHPDMLERIASTLLAIRDFWIPSKLEGGLDKKEAAEKALAALGVDDEGCFNRREKAKERPEYSVREGSTDWVLYDHFKYGNSRKNAEQYRIYYAWDDEGRRLIIGKMPSHLPNDQS